MKPLKPQIRYIITFNGVPEEDTSPEPLDRQWTVICYPEPRSPETIAKRKKEGWATRPVLCVPCDLVSVAALQAKIAETLCNHINHEIGDNKPVEESDLVQARLALSKIHPVLGAKPRA